MSDQVVCSLCTATTPNPLERGMRYDMPLGCSTVTIAERGAVLRSFLLCRPCTTAVRQEMHRLQAAHQDSLSTPGRGNERKSE